MLHDKKRKPAVITGTMTRLSGQGPALGALPLALAVLLLAAAPLTGRGPGAGF